MTSQQALRIADLITWQTVGGKPQINILSLRRLHWPKSVAKMMWQGKSWVCHVELPNEKLCFLALLKAKNCKFIVFFIKLNSSSCKYVDTRLLKIHVNERHDVCNFLIYFYHLEIAHMIDQLQTSKQTKKAPVLHSSLSMPLAIRCFSSFYLLVGLSFKCGMSLWLDGMKEYGGNDAVPLLSIGVKTTWDHPRPSAPSQPPLTTNDHMHMDLLSWDQLILIQHNYAAGPQTHEP